MKEFNRSDEYMTKIFLDALDRDVRLDVEVIIRQDPLNRRKLKAYCPVTGTNLQFPSTLRKYVGQKYICDVIKSARSTGAPFYRAYRKSIRDPHTGNVVA